MSWQRPEEIAVLLGVKPDSVVKKARRYEKSDGASEWVRRVAAVTEGGRPRVEIHPALVERWLAESEDSAEASSDGPASIAVREMHRARRAESDIARRLHEVEIKTRDEEISRLGAALMSKELEIARLRSQLASLGEALAAVTRDV